MQLRNIYQLENVKFSVNPWFTNGNHSPKLKLKAYISFLGNSNVPLLL